MRVFVTGGQGQVASSLRELAPNGWELIFGERPHFDLADCASIATAVDAAQPDVIISAAAYTAVDKAEDEPELAFQINGLAPGELARIAASRGVPIIHLSTDYVYDGQLDRAYCEADPVCPLGIYGRSKLMGEQNVADSGAKFLILRTAWVFSPFGQNFVKTMLKLAEDRDQLQVVDDQVGCPTSAHDIAAGIYSVIARWRRSGQTGTGQVYHFAGAGETTWAGFARGIFQTSVRLGGPAAEVHGIASSNWPTKARRPANSRLDSSKFRADFNFEPAEWSVSLKPVVKRLLQPVAHE